MTEEIPFGKSYDVMKRCVAISILDFNLTEDEEYHRTYLLRDEKGGIFTRLVELHVIELNKVLRGQSIDEWIRLFNVKTQEELDMLKMSTDNVGILEAINEVRHMSLSSWAKMKYDEHMKRIMDRKAEDAYVYEQGRSEGKAEERIQMIHLISKMNSGGDTDKIAQLNDPEVLEAMQKKYGIE